MDSGRDPSRAEVATSGVFFTRAAIAACSADREPSGGPISAPSEADTATG